MLAVAGCNSALSMDKGGLMACYCLGKACALRQVGSGHARQLPEQEQQQHATTTHLSVTLRHFLHPFLHLVSPSCSCMSCLKMLAMKHHHHPARTCQQSSGCAARAPPPCSWRWLMSATPTTLAAHCSS